MLSWPWWWQFAVILCFYFLLIGILDVLRGIRHLLYLQCRILKGETVTFTDERSASAPPEVYR